MKTVEEYFRLLSIGVLSNLAMSIEGSGEIREQDQGAVVAAMNEALLRLYTRFSLKENDVLIQEYDHITRYVLSKANSVSFGSNVSKYIMDSKEEPFEDDVVQIIGVYNASGYQYPLNDPQDHRSLFTPATNILQIPYPKAGRVISVAYQALAPTLTGDLNQMVDLTSNTLEGVFLNYVGYLIYTNMNTPESNRKASEFYQLYEATAQEIESKTQSFTGQSPRHSKFEERGFK